tara:strand:+ start:64 stop:1032 length:969 start_codon:yes stop_codon:yes gene_type:complete
MINNRWKKIERFKGIYLPTLPKIPILNKNTKVCLMGSCFADEMGYSLAANNINIGEVEFDKEMKMVKYPWGTFFSPVNIYNILEISLNDEVEKFFDESTFIRVPKDITGNHYESSKQVDRNKDHILLNLFFKTRFKTNNINYAVKDIKKKLTIFKNSIINSDVIIITLGLIETWIDKKKLKAWHSFHGNSLKKKSIENLADFKQLDFNEVYNYLLKTVNIINPKKDKKIIFTVSPIPLNFTFTDQDIVIANKYSKSLLRAAVEKVIDNKSIYYFPSYEIVQDCVGWPLSYKKDKRHVKVGIFKKYIAPKFIEAFTNFKGFKI